MRVVAVTLLLIVAVMSWQHMRYLAARRNVVQDRQPLLYPSTSFHVITYLELPEGGNVIDAVRELARAIRASGSATLVYAGQAAFVMESKQIGPAAWDAVVLVQYPSRQSYEAAAASDPLRAALAGFARTYSHGMQRPRWLNLAIPQGLLALRLVDVIRGHWNVEPLTPAPTGERSDRVAELDRRIAELLALRSVDDAALVVFNLTRPGTPLQQAADRSYGLKMLARMAALAHGPMHLGRAVAVEGDARFANVAIVYYPGVSYFAELAASRFFQGIIGDKQPGDTMAVPTVPILDRL